MKYEHNEVPEGINVTKVHPLRELVVLLGGAILIVLLIAYVLGLSAGHLARYIPFEIEMKMASSFVNKGPDKQSEIEAYLEGLKQQVVDAMDLPDGMSINLHYSSGETVNAFATLGGNVVMFRGLLEKLPNENALVMLLAHEIAHVKHRDPIVSVTRGLTISAVMSLVIGQTNLDVLGNTGLYTMLHFSREMESEADRAALEAVYKIYGHTNGADGLFHAIQGYREKMGVDEGMEFLRSHPLDRKRINAIGTRADENSWPRNGKPTAVPAWFFPALSKSVEKDESKLIEVPPKGSRLH